MKKIYVAILTVAAAAHVEAVKIDRVFDREVAVREVNYDKSKIGEYTLEDPLEFLDGRKVDAKTWPERRREMLGIFAREMYGVEPPPPTTLLSELVDEKFPALAGFAVRRQYKMYFKPDRSGPCINWIVWLPRHAKKPVPVILFLNYRGNHELVADPDIPVQSGWKSDSKVHRVTNNRASEATRGVQQKTENSSVFPLSTIIARGYAVMSACYCEVSPDPVRNEKNPAFSQDSFSYTGVFELWGRRDPSRTDDITSLGAWAWALSRGLDLAERIGEIDAKRSVVTGCSRLGKAALIAAARDERFAVCVANQTGGGGAPLAKRDYGENVSIECRSFSHWYCKAYCKYAADPAKLLTFDQHMLLACVAPRALMVQGFGVPWYDAEGEYLAMKAASPVWEMLKAGGLPKGEFPPEFCTSAIGRNLAYVRRSEAHGLSAHDWMWILDFADKSLSGS
jgi:hypothetical protein